MEETIFSKIANHEIPAHIVWEDDKFIAFLDVLPIEPGHVVVTPKTAYASLEDMPADQIGQLLSTAQKVGAAMLSGLGVKGYSLFLDNKDGANQHIPHVHLHVVPRAQGDGLGRWPQNAYETGEAEEYEAKIKSAIA